MFQITQPPQDEKGFTPEQFLWQAVIKLARADAYGKTTGIYGRTTKVRKIVGLNIKQDATKFLENSPEYRLIQSFLT